MVSVRMRTKLLISALLYASAVNYFRENGPS